jgi:cytidylate kinase
MIIAVDGPAASGKGTIARALATHYGLPHLDTGLLYRAVGLTLLRAGGDPESEADAAAATTFPDSVLADPELRTEATGALASRVSAHAAVRAALMARQRAFAHQPGGAVLDGRDIGTVIAPEAGAKLYVTASPRVRAERRAREMERMGHMASTAFPSRDDFAALLNESFGGADGGFEGRVVKGTVTAIENDMVLIDVGLKSEGRVALREFAMPGMKADIKVGDEVEVYVDRVENAMAKPMLSRDRARREAAWDKLEAEFQEGNPRRGRHLRPRQGRLHRRSRWRRGVPARQPGRYPPGARRHPADGHSAAVPDPQDGPSPWQHRRFAPRDP